jgi:hypothetical protein
MNYNDQDSDSSSSAYLMCLKLGKPVCGLCTI